MEEKPGELEVAWGLPLVAVYCTGCGEAHLVSGDSIPPRCPLCLRETLTLQSAPLRTEPPEEVLPYEILQSKLAGLLSAWARGVPLRPDELKAEVLTRRARRYFIPLWLVDGEVRGEWRADVGFEYQAVSFQDRYVDRDGWHSQEVRELRVRWEPRAGRINRRYQNLAVPALIDHHALMKQLGGYDLGRRARYTPEAVAGAMVRVPAVEPEAAWPDAEAAFVRAAEDECRLAAGADHIRDFRLAAEYRDLNWTLLLLPAYITWYREGEQFWPVLINGQNGHISGVRRASVRKGNLLSLILGGVALFLFALGGLLALSGALVPPLVALGGLMLVLGLLVGILAPIPALSVWVFNRQ